MSDEEERGARHRQDQLGSRLTATPTAPWPETADLPLSQDEGLTGRLWALDGLDGVTDAPVAEAAGGGLVALGYIRAAVRRSARFWCALAVAGLLIGAAVYKAFPPSYQASTTVLLANNPFEQISNAVLDDQQIVQSRTVASAALRRLDLHESPGTFQSDYSALVLTNRLLSITVKAASYPTAVREANAVAAAFIAFQKRQALALETLNNSSLQQSINAAEKNIASISARIKSLSSQPASRAQHAELTSLLAQRSKANANLVVLQQSTRTNAASMKINTAVLINGTQVLDPAAPLPQHATRYRVLYVGGGLVIGLVIGLFIVVIRAIVSDKLRRRDDVARALGAPVKLSVGQIGQRRWRRGPQGLAAADSPEVRRIVTHLEREVPPSWGGLASLAVVPVDDPQIPALCLVSLALSCAQQGFQVVVADLYRGSPAARLLGVSDPGVQRVSVRDANLVLAIPDPDDVAPLGPLARRSRRAQADEPLADACASADLLFTLAAVDPAIGAGHLSGWTRGAVAMVTAGESSAARIQAVGEMIRLAGIERSSAILLGADKTDESLGVTDTPSPSAMNEVIR
jgi:capsular polysaccharide biosynthesis protein